MTIASPRVIHDPDGLNTAAAPGDLLGDFVTPTTHFFTRSHGPVPGIDPSTWRLEITGLVKRPLVLTLADLRGHSAQHEVGATLVCAGLRRNEFLTLGSLPGELPWGPNCVSHGRWGGVRLAAILDAAGIAPEADHVEFVGMDRVERHGIEFGFAGSISLEKARDPDVLVAVELNGQTLPVAHGFPARVVVPGWVGARSVKWLREIRVTAGPSTGYFQTEAYRIQRTVDPDRPRDVTKGEVIDGVPINSAILDPAADQRVPAGPVTVRGWALGSNGHPIATVEISPDDGRSWQTAKLTAQGGQWTWAQWEGILALPPGRHRLAVRATDTTGARQPANLEEVWNVKGYCNNAWHRVAVTVE